MAIKSPFGWTVGGHVPKTVVTRHVNSIHALKEDSNLERQIARWWEIESFGIGHDSGNPLSSQDSKALDMLKSSLRFKDSHYEVGLLWREEEVSLPDNRNTALRRLYALERRFAREAPAFVERYASAIECYVKDGHARKLNHSEVMVQDGSASQSRVWYLPHHAVIHPAKPEKIHVVFDASAKHQGVSLNDVLLKGPDLTENLATILLRFRNGPIAVSSDIEKMFLQVGVKESDQRALRFVWRPPGSTKFPDTYQMKVQVFGAVSSPTSCSFVLQNLAETYNRFIRWFIWN